MAELTPDLPVPVREAIGRGARTIVLRMEPQPWLSGFQWVWAPPEGYVVSWEQSPPKQLFERSPLGQAGDILVVGTHVEVDTGGFTPWGAPINDSAFEEQLRLPVVSVAVKQLGELVEVVRSFDERLFYDDVENVFGRKLDFYEYPDYGPPFLSACKIEGELASFYNSYNPSHPWNAEDWAWVAEVKR